MVHTIRFRAGYVSDLQRPGQSRLERVRLEVGLVIHARMRPWIKETSRGPIEVADLECDDGALLAVPFAAFQFVERDE